MYIHVRMSLHMRTHTQFIWYALLVAHRGTIISNNFMIHLLRLRRWWWTKVLTSSNLFLNTPEELDLQNQMKHMLCFHRCHPLIFRVAHSLSQ